MQVSVEAPSKLERKLTVVVPVEKLTEVYNKRIEGFAKKAKISGFRPGKAPLQVVQQHYGNTARQEALSEVIQSSLYAAISQEKLSPVGTPTVEPKVIDPNLPLEYVATFEVLPEVGAVNFTLNSLDKQVATITDADIEKVLTHLREQHTRWQKADRAVQEKDKATIDFKGSIDGVVFQGGEAHDYPIVIGSKMMIPGFEEGIVGMKTGEEKVIKVTFPANYFAKEVAGKVAEFAVKVIRIEQPELPELNADFIKKLGIKSGDLAELQAEIRKNLDRELDRVVKMKLKNQVFDQLIAQNKLEIPKALIETESKRIHDEVHPHHGHEHHHTDEEMATFNQAAERNVALGLLIAEVLKQHKLVVDKARVQAYLANLSTAYENPEEVLKWYSSNKKAYAEAEMHVVEDLVIEKLLENVKVTEKMISYNELVNQ